MVDPTAVQCLTDLDQHRAAWDALAATARPASPFSRVWWLSAVAEGLPRGEGARYVLVVAGDRLMGGVALVEDRLLGVPRYRFLGQGILAPDHLDLLALPGAEDVVAAAISAWFHRRGTRLLHLDGLDEGALIHRAIEGWVRPIEAAPYAMLPATVEEFMAARSTSFRRSLRRAARRLADTGHRHERVSEDKIADAMAVFWSLHRERGDRSAILTQARVLDAAVLAGVRHGECRVDVLRSESGPIAVSIAFQLEGRVSLYQVARSTKAEYGSAGSVLITEVIADALRQGCREADLLRGEEPYKQHFAAHLRPMATMWAAHGAVARVFVLLRKLGVAAVTTARRARSSRSG